MKLWIWKSYMWTVGWRVMWKYIIAVIDATFVVAKRKPEKKILSFCNFKSCVFDCDDLLLYNSSPRSSHIWFSYIHNYIIILSRVYNEQIQQPVPSWLVSLILVEHCTGIAEVKGSNPVQAWIFFLLAFHKCKSCVYNYDDLLSPSLSMI